MFRFYVIIKQQKQLCYYTLKSVFTCYVLNISFPERVFSVLPNIFESILA